MCGKPYKKRIMPNTTIFLRRHTMNNKIKVFTAFSGYDSQCLALRWLGLDFDLVGWSEIDRYAIQAHNRSISRICRRQFYNSHIRKLTPRECLRLMNMHDLDIDKLLDANISATQLCKMAGNSICIITLSEVFRKMFVDTDNEEQQQLTIF